MMALTVKQPWAWAIIHAGKDVENRRWPTTYRGPLAIHAGLKTDSLAPWSRPFVELDIQLPPSLYYGAIIGVVDLIDCINISDSPWAELCMWHWRLANPRAVEPRPWRGRQGLFTVTTRLEIRE